MLLLGAFGGVALVLAAVGVYAMFAALVVTRQREFGIRIALGSTPVKVVVLILRYGAKWTAAGLLFGAFGVLVIGRAVQNLLFDVSPFDAATIAATVGVVTAAALVALIVPTYKAARLDPLRVLRGD